MSTRTHQKVECAIDAPRQRFLGNAGTTAFFTGLAGARVDVAGRIDMR